MTEPCVRGFEAILGSCLLAMRMLREQVKGASNAGARQKGGRDDELSTTGYR
jgi:hypothetical protein